MLARTNDATWLSGCENCRDGVASTFPNYHNNLALAALVPWQTDDPRVFFELAAFTLPLK
jgi:hypothetical protein